MSPTEINHLWDIPEARDLKAELTRKLLFAETVKDTMAMPRVSGA